MLSKTLADFQLQETEAVAIKEDSDEKTAPDVTQKIVALDKDNVYYKQTNRNLKRKLREMISTWDSEKQAMDQKVQAERQMWESERVAWESRANSFLTKHEQLEKDHQALKEELENTKSLMHKAGLGIRLPVRNVRELTEGDVDQRSSQSLPMSRGDTGTH